MALIGQKKNHICHQKKTKPLSNKKFNFIFLCPFLLHSIFSSCHLIFLNSLIQQLTSSVVHQLNQMNMIVVLMSICKMKFIQRLSMRAAHIRQPRPQCHSQFFTFLSHISVNRTKNTFLCMEHRQHKKIVFHFFAV